MNGECTSEPRQLEGCPSHFPEDFIKKRRSYRSSREALPFGDRSSKSWSRDKKNSPNDISNGYESASSVEKRDQYESNHFHYSKTLPPDALLERTDFDTNFIHDENSYSLPRTSSSRFQQGDTDGQGMMTLRLRVEAINGLVPSFRALHNIPSTFVEVQAACGCGRTPAIDNNANPSFNDEFVLHISNVETEEITLMLIAVTKAGNKKVGQCVLSVANLMRGVLRRQWVTLVRHPATQRAYDYGVILISLYTDSFGVRSLPPVAKENEFRERLRVLLRKNAPAELHRLEWYVGKFVDDYDSAFASLSAKFRKKAANVVSFQLTIKSVSDLTESNANPTVHETCYVQIIADRLKKTTKMVPYYRLAQFNETFDLMLENPHACTISLLVYSANHKFGECLISLNGLQRGVPKERTHSIVYAAGTGDAFYCGTITVILCSTDYGVDQPLNNKSDETARIRVRNYLWKYLRDKLHRLDPIVTSSGDIDSLISSWEREHGPEPAQHSMNLRIQCISFESREYASVSFSVIVRVGPEIYRTSSQRFTDGSKFNYDMDITVCDPDKDEVLFIVVRNSGVNDVEIGRVTTSLKHIQKGKPFQNKLQFYQNALTANAKRTGSISIECITQSFGLTNEVTNKEGGNNYRKRVEALLSRYNPSQLYRIEYHLAEFLGREEQLIKHLTDSYGPETGTAPMRIRLLGIRDFIPMCPCYVKVYFDNVPVLRTNDHYAAKFMRFDISMKNETTVSLEDPIHSMLKFKVAEHRRFRSNRILGLSEMSLRNMLRQEPNVYWLPIFDSVEKEIVGELGVELQSTGFTKGTVTIYSTPRNRSGRSVFEEVAKDVTSLIRKYRPQDLLHVHPLIAQASSLKEAHREIRSNLTSNSIAFTFYVSVDKIDFVQDEKRNALKEGLISVSASCLGEKGRSSMKIAWEKTIDTRRYYPDMRMDIALPQDSNVTRNVPSLEIVLHELTTPSSQQHLSVANRSGKNPVMRLLTQEKELGRVVLSIRALLTEEIYEPGEPIKVCIVHSLAHTTPERAPYSALGTDRVAIVAEVTLRILTPVFENIPRWFRFNRKGVRRFHSAYVRCYEKRIASFYGSYDPFQLYNFHLTLYERDVASGKWPTSLNEWLLSLIRHYGPEPRTKCGSPPKLPFDPEKEEEGEEEKEEDVTNGKHL